MSVDLTLHSLFYVPSFSLMFAWGWVGGPRGGTYEISAGQREARCGASVYLALHSLFNPNFH